jgi:beta-N-acetylhexosaminidase
VSVLVGGCASDTGGDPRASGAGGAVNPPETTSASKAGSASATASEPSSAATSGGSPSPAAPNRVHQLLGELSLADKVRQLLVVSFAGTIVPSAMIRRVRPGGVIYFADNLVDAEQAAALSAGLQRVSRRVGLPLLVSADQEGGSVTRLPTAVSGMPAGTQLGGNAGWARRVAYETGSAMRRLGLNLDFAPVADVNTVGEAGVIGPRSFGASPTVVSELVRAQVCGLHAGGVAATVKHFPGHGSTAVDSHLALPVLRLTKGEWRAVHLPPFTRAMAAGVDAVMVGHLAFPRLDLSGQPASLSRPMVTRWLRGRLGYDGVVVTDSLEMAAVSSYGSSAQLAVRAVRAGVDLLLMPQQPGAAARGLVEAVRSGRISMRRINQSVERVLALKDRLGLLGSRPHLRRC